MTPAACLRVLGLGEVASVTEIKHAYRELAQQFHPDKHGGDEQARKQFIDIANAYRTLMRITRAVQEGRPVGTCCMCLGLGEIVQGLDGQSRCVRCALQGARRMLPLPPLVVVKCLVSIGLIAAAGYLLLVAIATRSVIHALLSFIVGVLALAALAYTCLTVVYCVRPRKAKDRLMHARVVRQ